MHRTNFLCDLNVSLWGPMTYGPSPFTRGESESPRRGELWPELSIQDPRQFWGYSRGQFSSRQTQKPTRERGKAGMRLNLEENLKISGEKLLSSPFNALHLTEPYPSTVTTTPNHFTYGLMGQISALESQTYTWVLENGCMPV